MKFKSPAQFSVDHLSHLVVPKLILLLCSFIVSTYVINRFIFFSTETIFAIQLYIMYFPFILIDSNGVD